MFCCFWRDLVSVSTARGIRSRKIVVHSNGLGYLFGKNCRPFEQLGLSVSKKKLMSSIWTAWAVRLENIVICLNGLGYPFQKIVIPLNGLGYPFQKIVIRSDAIHLKKNLSTVGGTEPICSKIDFSRISIPNHFISSHSCQTMCYSPGLVCYEVCLQTYHEWLLISAPL